MCRFLNYLGPEVLMSDLLINANNSLIAQSKQSLKSKRTVNGDGFGIGWYPLHDDNEPGIFTSITPAWSNHNLQTLTLKLRTRVFSAHIRDATPGLAISSNNCHPFTFGPYLWMHNGEIGGFETSKRSLLNSLSDRAFYTIRGSTDSELAFAMFLDTIEFQTELNDKQLYSALCTTIQKILRTSVTKEKLPSILNFSISNGLNTVVTRFCCNPEKTQPASLFYLHGTLSKDSVGNFETTASDRNRISTIISSEPLSLLTKSWNKIDRNYAILATIDKKPIIENISF
jgi:glutamine amidotransferase